MIKPQFKRLKSVSILLLAAALLFILIHLCIQNLFKFRCTNQKTTNLIVLYQPNVDSINIVTAILGYDNNLNFIRDDIEGYIDKRFEQSPCKRASYKFLAKSIQRQWTQLFYDKSITYNELVISSVDIAFGLDLIEEYDSLSNENFTDFIRKYINTKDRILFENKLSDKFIGKILPVYVKKDPRYIDQINRRTADFNEMLILEKKNNK